MRLLGTAVFADLAMDSLNRTRNCFSDVWYITLIILISVIRKYRMLPLVATETNKYWLHTNKIHVKKIQLLLKFFQVCTCIERYEIFEHLY